MTLINITDRGTLRGIIYRGAGSGTTDYTQLSNKPQINEHTLQGNQSGDDLDLIDKGSLEINEITLEGSMTGDDLGLVNSADLSFNVGYSSSILHNIKYKNNTYNAYADPFSGASSGQNGKMGLVPAPLSSQGDYNKFLKGNGTWVNIYSETVLYDSGSNINGVPFNAITNLLDNLSKYDAIMVEWNTANDRTRLSPEIVSDCVFCLTSRLLSQNFVLHFAGYGTRWGEIKFTDTKFIFRARGGDLLPEIYTITGIKYH